MRDDPRSRGAVQVLGADPKPPHRHGVAAATAAASVVVLLGALLGSVDSGDPSTPSGPPDTSAAPASNAVTTPTAPDLVGLWYGEIDWFLLDAGFLPQVDASWVAGGAPAGRVLAQTPSPGTTVSQSTLFTVVVSAGGPAIASDDLPDHIRRWVTAVDGFSFGEPILVVSTSSGDAYKSDALLFGECGAVALAEGAFDDASYRTECLEPVGQRLSRAT